MNDKKVEDEVMFLNILDPGHTESLTGSVTETTCNKDNEIRSNTHDISSIPLPSLISPTIPSSRSTDSQSSSESWCLVESISYVPTTSEIKTGREFLNMCENRLKTSVHTTSKDPFQSLLKIEKVLRMYGHEFANNCYVQGFIVAALANDVKICAHIFATRNVLTGTARTKIEMLWRDFMRGKTKDNFDPKLFISCCENGSDDVVEWMLSVNLFIPKILYTAFEIGANNQNTRIMNILYKELYIRGFIDWSNLVATAVRTACEGKIQTLQWFFSANERLVVSLLTEIMDKICRNGKIDSLDFILSQNCPSVQTVLKPESMYHWFISACMFGHKHIADALRRYDARYYAENMENVLFNDPERKAFFLTLANNHHDVLTWLNGLKHYHLTITVLDMTEASKIVSTIIVSSTVRDIDIENWIHHTMISALSHYVIADPQKPSHRINGCGTKVSNFKDVKSHETTFNDRVIIHIFKNSLRDATKTGHYETMFNCRNIKSQRNNDLCVINFVIQIQTYMNPDALCQVLGKCETIKEKNIIAGLIGHLSYPSIDLTYKDMMIEKLGINVAEENSEIVTKIMYETDECPLCMCEYDMVLSCGHVMCMSCAAEWYLTKQKPMICYCCQKPFTMSHCYCLC